MSEQVPTEPPAGGEPPAPTSESARALGGLAVAERRWYLALRVLMIAVVSTLIAGNAIWGYALDRPSAFVVLGLITLPTLLGVRLHLRGHFTDGWLLALMLSDIVVITLGNHWAGGVESSFGYAYLAVVLGSALFLDQGLALLCAFGSAFAYVELVLLEYAGILEHHDFLGTSLEHNTNYVVYECTMKSITFLACSLVATAVVSSARRAYARLEEQERRMRQFAVEVLAMQEAESRRIARELHDGAGQALTAARLHLQAAAAAVAQAQVATSLNVSVAAGGGGGSVGPVPVLVMPESSRLVRDSILATARLLDAAMDEVRQSAAALGPTTLDELGLVEALRRHCDGIRAASRIEVAFTAPPGESDDQETVRAPAAIERACYRIAQEALTNAVRHAQPNRIEVHVLSGSGVIGIDIRDDGCGFDPASPRQGLGLQGMRDRVTLLGGSFTIDSMPGHGTRVRAIIPVHQEGEP